MHKHWYTPLGHEQNKCSLDAENKPSTLAAGTLHGIRCVCKRKLVFLKSAKPLLVLVRVFYLNEWWPTLRVPILSTCTCSCVPTMLSSRLCVAVFRLAFTNLKRPMVTTLTEANVSYRVAKLEGFEGRYR